MKFAGYITALLISTVSCSAATFHVAQTKHASDKNSGTAEAPFLTIARGAQAAQPGDTVLVHAGTYRECIRPTRGGTGPDKMITYQAAPGERVVIKGSNIFSPNWQPVDSGDLKSDWFVQADLPDNFFEPNTRYAPDGKPALYNPFKTPLIVDLYVAPAARYEHRKAQPLTQLVIGEVYAHGKPLGQTRTLEECRLKPGSYYVPIDGKKLIVNFYPFSKGQVELTVREQCFAPVYRGLGYIRVSGFAMEQCANQGPFPQAGVISTRSGHHWIIENNVVRYGATIGIDCGSEIACYYMYPKDTIKLEGEWAPGSTPAIYEVEYMKYGWKSPKVNHIDQPAPAQGHLIRNNIVSDHGLCGIMALKAEDLVIEGNVIERNNRRRLYAGADDRTTQSCETGGIKLHLTKRSVIRNNLVRDQIGWAPGVWLDNANDYAQITGNVIINNFLGVDLEINDHPNLVANNIIAFSRNDGLSSRDSSQVQFIHNLVLYSGRWGCCINFTNARGNNGIGYMGRPYGPPQNCLVKNNIFAGSVENRAIRLPMPTKEFHNNVVSGNLIDPGDRIFQLENFDQKTPMPIDKFVATATDWLTQRKLPKNLWPDFKTWKVQDSWYLGECDFAPFNAIVGAPDNRMMNIAMPEILSQVDPYLALGAEAWPWGETNTLIPPRVVMTIDASAWPTVDPTPEVKTDFFATPLPAKAVLPGPLQEAKQKKTITLWPKPMK